MAPELIYFLKVNLAILIFYAFYRLFFYKDTFFHLRRFSLLALFMVAMVYPVLNIQEWIREQNISEAILVYSNIMPEAITEKAKEVGTDWIAISRLVAVGIYATGILFFILRFIIQLTSIIRLKKGCSKTKLYGVPVYEMNRAAGPFSFFRWIFLHIGSHSREEISEIMTHELTHVRQWHSIDVIVSEIICIICWINPFVWLLKREVRHNLEYLADSYVLDQGYDSKNYQYHLLGLAHHPPGSSIYNSFNLLHLKNRIRMMNMKRTNGLFRFKYLFHIPLALLLLMISNIDAIARVTNKLVENITSTGSSSPINTLIDYELKELFSFKKGDPPGKEDLIVVNQIFTVVESMPRFPGGEGELMKYISNTIRYPEDAKAEGIQGRVVCSFTIDYTGAIRDSEVLRGIHPSLDNEAIRVIGTMPKWTPGKQRGLPVAVRYTLPVVFRIR